MSIIDNVRKISADEYVAAPSLPSNSDESSDKAQFFAELLNLPEEDAARLVSTLRKIEDDFDLRQTSGDADYMQRYQLNHINEKLLLELCRSFGSFAEMRRALAPIYAYLRCAIVFDATSNTVSGMSKTLDVPSIG